MDNEQLPLKIIIHPLRRGASGQQIHCFGDLHEQFYTSNRISLTNFINDIIMRINIGSSKQLLRMRGGISGDGKYESA
jgi:hypothetical protein